MQSSGSASDKQRELPLVLPGDEPDAGNRGKSDSVHLSPLMGRVLSRDNLSRALKQVRRNKGAPGIGGMTVDALPDYLRKHWPEVRQRLVKGSYYPQPLRRFVIPKPQGGERPRGIPTVLDRFIQQAIAQVIQGGVGGRLPPPQLRFPARPLGASGRAARAERYPCREKLGGRPRPGGLL